MIRVVWRKKDKNDRNPARRQISMVDLRTGGARSSATGRENAEQNVQGSETGRIQTTPPASGNVAMHPHTPYEDLAVNCPERGYLSPQ